MGKRKRLMAERLKETKKQTAIAVLKDAPTSPRKMRLVADTVRGVEVNHALDLLHYSKKEASIRLEKLLRSAIANWEAKNPEQTRELENGNVIVPAGPCRTHPQAFQPRHHHPGRQKSSGGINYGTED